MTDIIEFLSIVNWPGAIFLSVAVVVCGWIVVKCYGRN